MYDEQWTMNNEQGLMINDDQQWTINNEQWTSKMDNE